MKIAIKPCRSASRGLMIFGGCLLLCILTCVSAAAQEENVSWQGASLYDYAEISFAVPTELEDMVQGESRQEGNYSEGRYVVASVLFGDSRVYFLLLYPCDPPEAELDAAGLKSAIESFNQGWNQTVYGPAPLNISDKTAIAGQLDNQGLIAYQPSIQTVSVILIDENVTEDLMSYFPESLRITVNESSSPLWPGYCPGDETVETVEPQVAPAAAETPQAEQAVQTGSEVDPEQVEADVAAIREKMKSTFNIKM